jgi:DNA mismatch endonuclease, patch repair protein
MTDIFDVKKRSQIMSHIKGSGNKTTEQRLIAVFKQLRITGWRRRYHIFGNPDFVFHKQKVAVFVDGCFWHGHDCRNTKPNANKEFWAKKISKNRERDRDVSLHLEKLGWEVIRIWECDLVNKRREELLQKIGILMS